MSSHPPILVDVLLPLALNQPYTYRLPAALQGRAGSYVRVPLGPRHVIGVIWCFADADKLSAKLRDVAEVFDVEPMPETHRRFIDWLSDYYVEPKGNVLRLCLRVPAVFEPPRLKHALRATGSTPHRMTPQRARVLDFLKSGLSLRPVDLTEQAGVSAAVITSLVKDGALERVALPPHRSFQQPDLEAGALPLSTIQQAAADELCALVNSHSHKVALLDGVTGSGKTEVYFEAMARSLKLGHQVLLLLPEIALTQAFITRVERRFGCAPARWHSGLKVTERERVWRGVADGSARITVGARSALFLPWKDLGLIIVDEEHEQAYKQDEGVPYHARDMAVLYGSIGKFPVILSSATPSLETLVNADRERYAHIRLQLRHGARLMPDVRLLDMRQASLEAGQWMSDQLTTQVQTTLEKGEQALLFLNRRGYAPLTLCWACGHRLECPQCAASLVEHRFRRQLMCHHCGHHEPIPSACPACHAEGKLKPVGPGIERLAEEARLKFPDSRIAILSSDLSVGSHLNDTLREVEQGERNLIIGTQLVAKGHHFPQLTFVGVVDADLALESSDPRAGERTWALMAQVSGRAGRGEKPGQALVQTFKPEHPLMQALVRNDRDAYLIQERALREQAQLPPYTQLAAVIVSGPDAVMVETFTRDLLRAAPLSAGITLLGPVPAPLHTLRGRHRWRFLIKAVRAQVKVQDFLRAWLKDVKPKASMHIGIDVDPYNFL